MSENDSFDALDIAARNKRVQELCSQLTDLVRLSLDQRRAIDRLLDELETITTRLPERLRVRAAGAGAGRRPAAEGTPRRPGTP